jgi:DNA-binding transcriptional LysR family regulator
MSAAAASLGQCKDLILDFNLDRFLAIQAFVRVAESRSFVSAAQQIGVTRSVITSRVKKLESFVQASLFHRSTRKVTLSEVGRRVFDECAELLVRADSVTDRMRLVQNTPLGLLRVQVLPGFALGHLGRALKNFSVMYPHISLDITVSDRTANPIDEGYDIALQIFRPGAELLIERHLFEFRRVFCASPAYLRGHGMPKTPNDLLKHDIGLYSAYPTRNRWHFQRGEEEISIELPARVRSNSVHLLRDFALSAGGITCLPTLVCGADLVSGALVPLLTAYELPLLDLMAIYPATLRRTLKVKLFVDFIRKQFAGEPEWDVPLSGVPGLENFTKPCRAVRQATATVAGPRT